MEILSPKQQYILDALETGVPAIVSTSQSEPVRDNPFKRKVIYRGTAAALKGLALRGLIEYEQQWRCAIVIKK